MKKRFKFLQTLSTIFKILGILFAALSLIGGIVLLALIFNNSLIWSYFGLNAESGFSIGLSAAILIIIVGILNGLFVYGFGEMIEVLISLEENTYKASIFLEAMQKDEE